MCGSAHERTAIERRFWQAVVRLVVILFGIGCGAAHATDLGIGDPAPPIIVKKFVKGAPMSKLPAGRISVVEFWTSSIKPCRDLLLTLPKLKKQYPQIAFLGVSVFEEDPQDVGPFVARLGSKFDIPLAIDLVSDAPDADPFLSGKMVTNWLLSVGVHEVPIAFIVDKDGKIAWIGDPSAIEGPLKGIVAGKWDRVAAAAAFLHKLGPGAELLAKLKEATKSGDPNKVLVVLNEGLAKTPSLETSFGLDKFRLMLRMGGNVAEAAPSYGVHLVDVVNKDDAESLAMIAFQLIDTEDGSRPDAASAALALRAAKRADMLAKGMNSIFAETLAKALFATGDAAGAVVAETRAMALTSSADQERWPQMQQELAAFRAAAAAAP